MNTSKIIIPDNIRLVYRASNLAAKLHQHQKRKDGSTPYIAHLLRVPHILSCVFGCKDAVTIAAGILHDAIEDTTADYDEIAESTSSEVADLVAFLTNDMRLAEPQRDREYDDRLAAAPWQARLIKLADVFDNLCDSCLSGVNIEIQGKVERALALAGSEPELAQAAAHLRQLGMLNAPQ